MACFYACVARPGNFTYVKFGITMYNTPWSRLATIARSRDNPWGAKNLAPAAFMSIALPDTYNARRRKGPLLRHARAIEGRLKSLALRALPRANRWQTPGLELHIPTNEHGCSPSGEWMFFGGSEDEAIEQFFGLALSALSEPVARYDDASLFAHAYERVSRAAWSVLDDGGFVASTIRCANGDTCRPEWS